MNLAVLVTARFLAFNPWALLVPLVLLVLFLAIFDLFCTFLALIGLVVDHCHNNLASVAAQHLD